MWYIRFFFYWFAWSLSPNITRTHPDFFQLSSHTQDKKFYYSNYNSHLRCSPFSHFAKLWIIIWWLEKIKNLFILYSRLFASWNKREPNKSDLNGNFLITVFWLKYYCRKGEKLQGKLWIVTHQMEIIGHWRMPPGSIINYGSTFATI